MWFRVGQTDIRFGKLELCLVTSLQFGQMPTGVVYNFKDVKGGVLDRYFGGELPTFDMILQRLDQGNFSHANDAIKLAYLFLGHVLLGIEYQKTVPRWAYHILLETVYDWSGKSEDAKSKTQPELECRGERIWLCMGLPVLVYRVYSAPHRSAWNPNWIRLSLI
ncbi:hypothetical protein LWI28_002598 [Acer negundo]|uniref:Uncharacterized protein n=1 Tax=Acer negundo TaxID=4023 RepID=A0AAD5II74_ACENE|nr:hypothetical protein LWI28_002598 [Acer negundo]